MKIPGTHFFVGVVLLFSGPCGPTQKAGEADATQGVHVMQAFDGVELSLTLSRGQVSRSRGTVLDAVLKIRNRSGNPVEMTFPSSRLYDFELWDLEENLLWRWSQGRAFLTVIMEKVLDTEPWEFSENIRLEDPFGSFRPLGEYRVVARLVPSSIHPPPGRELLVSANFRIVE